MVLVLGLLAPSCGGGSGSSTPRVRIVAIVTAGTEGGTAARFSVTRTGEVRDALAVACVVSGTVSNAAGGDFAEAPFPNPVRIPAGSRGVEIAVTPIGDALPEGNETLTVTLLRAQGRYELSREISATVTILDDDPLVTEVTVAEAKALVDAHAGDPFFAILDVRMPVEFVAGHLAGALNIDVLEPGFAASAARLDPSWEYLLHCRSGTRSALALVTLRALGFTTIHHMYEGFDGWVAAGYPVATD
jgi:rhodanese-related sulfurtransferase